MSLRQVSTNTQNFFEQQDLFYAGSDHIEYTVYFRHIRHVCFTNQWRSQEFCSASVQQIQLRTEDRENGDVGAVAP